MEAELPVSRWGCAAVLMTAIACYTIYMIVKLFIAQ